MTQRAKGASARAGRVPESFSLDISWTPVPWGYQVPTPSSLDYNTNEAASLATPGGLKAGIEASKQYLSLLSTQMKNITDAEKEGEGPKEIPTKNDAGKQVEPEDHLVCYDYLYFMATYTVSKPLLLLFPLVSSSLRYRSLNGGRNGLLHGNQLERNFTGHLTSVPSLCLSSTQPSTPLHPRRSHLPPPPIPPQPLRPTSRYTSVEQTLMAGAASYPAMSVLHR